MTAKYYLATGSGDNLEETKKLDNALWLVIAGTIAELTPVSIQDRGKTKSAISAFSDASMMGDFYLNKDSKPGMHIFGSADMGAEYADRVGVVHQSIGPNERFPQPREEICYRGWANVEIDNGIFMAEAPRDLRTNLQRDQGKLDTRLLMSWKHSYIDAILKGYTLHIWIAHMRPYLAKLISTWKLRKISDRWDARNKAIGSRVVFDRHFREPAREDYSRRINGGEKQTDPETGVITRVEPGEVTLVVDVMNQGEKQVLTELPAGSYTVYTKRGQALGFSVEWDPDSPFDNLSQWEILASAEYKIAVG